MQKSSCCKQEGRSWKRRTKIWVEVTTNSCMIKRESPERRRRLIMRSTSLRMESMLSRGKLSIWEKILKRIRKVLLTSSDSEIWWVSLFARLSS
jgi:hypothetical protein